MKSWALRVSRVTASRSLWTPLTGLRHPSGGTIEINGSTVHFNNARMAHNAGIAHIPEERIKYGVVANLALYENSVLKRHRESGFGNWISMKYNVIKTEFKRFDSRFPGGCSIHTHTDKKSLGRKHSEAASGAGKSPAIPIC